jgi:hypothetical protein
VITGYRVLRKRAAFNNPSSVDLRRPGLLLALP